MNTQTFYPVFENGQVLTSEHLNDIIDYLEPQDRLTRSRLTGIGILCGLEPNWSPAARTLTLSKGVAVTSEGYLIAEDAVVLDRFRTYTVPIPSSPDATAEAKAKARYPFLFDGNTQREAVELLPTDFQPAPGEPAPTALSDAFVADKAVLLFLECNLEALKNCNINDCSDKGSEMNLTLRRLLVKRSIADKILQEEAAIAGRPVDRANHPRLGLTPLALEKINPALFQIDSLAKLYSRILSAVGKAGQQLLPAMRDAWAAYQALLADPYPASQFPDGPIPKTHFLNLLAAFAETPTLAQYLHGALHDILRSYNEFIACAARFDAECSPDPRRFPKHVLADDALARPVAFAKAPASLADYAGYDPLAATGGPAPEGTPAARRHHFVPSPALDAGNDQAAELRALFARMVLLAQTYATRGLVDAPIQLTPSRDGAAPLGERAIPFYYRFQATGDLFRNWSWRKAREHALGTIFSYQFTATAKDHPLLLRQDGEDFIRIEGIVGKPLGTAMGALIQQKQALGVSFGIEPVWLGYGAAGADGAKPDAAAKALALQAVQKLLLCRMRDLDVIFLMVMAALFAFLVWLVQALGRLDAAKTTTKKTLPAAAPSAAPQPAVGATIELTRVAGFQSVGILKLDTKEQLRLRTISDSVLTRLRAEKVVGGDVVKTLVAEGAGDQVLEPIAVANVYDKVRDRAVGGELIDRLRAVSGDLGVAGDPEELTNAIYPSVALLARSEEMMQVTSVASVSEFDEAKFATAMRGFADAYENYAAKAETDPAKSSKDIADTNAAIVGSRAAVADTAAQFSSAAITAELGKRLASMFEDLILPGYARKHPGLEHKAGVPVGGTFVLVYGSRQDMETGIKAALAGIAPAFASHFSKLVEATPPDLSIDRAVQEIVASSKPQSEDVLDEFVVLGDFCLPYLCCDADCSDVEVEKRIIGKQGVVKAETGGVASPTAPTPPTPPPVAGTTGTVEVAIIRRDPLSGREVAVKNAVLLVTDLATGKSTKKQLTEATLKLELAEGKYQLAATLDTRKSAAVEVAVKAGASVPARLVIL